MEIQLHFRHFLPFDTHTILTPASKLLFRRGVKSRKDRQPKRTNSRISKIPNLFSIWVGNRGDLRLRMQAGRPVGNGRMFVWDEGTAGSNPCSAWLCLSQWIFNKSQFKLVHSRDLNIIFHIQQNFQNVSTSPWMTRNVLISLKMRWNFWVSDSLISE